MLWSNVQIDLLIQICLGNNNVLNNKLFCKIHMKWNICHHIFCTFTISNSYNITENIYIMTILKSFAW